MAVCLLTFSWRLPTLNSMGRWLTSFTVFIIPNCLVATFSPEQNSLGGRMPMIQCYVLPLPTVVQYKTFLHNPPFFFNTSSAADRSTRLFISSSLDLYLTSKRILDTLEISTQPQIRRQTQSGQVFPQMIWCLGRCSHFKGANAPSK